MSTRGEMIEQKLHELETAVPSIEGAAVISLDGLIMASVFRADIEEDRVAAMSSALLSIAQRVNEQLGRGDFERAIVSGGRGYVVLTPAGSQALLASVCPKEAKLGLILYEIRRISKDIAGIVPVL